MRGAGGTGAAVLRGTIVGMTEGRTLVAAPCEPLATETVGSYDGAYVPELWRYPFADPVHPQIAIMSATAAIA